MPGLQPRADEISIHLVPVLFGSGTRLFENLGSEHTQLAITEVIETAEAIHLRLSVAK
jgi:riboflavin biosynthesis pyrimidine reductase